MGKRFKDLDWNLPTAPDGLRAASWDVVQVAVLMDLRDELQAIRSALAPLRHLDCGNFLAIPAKLEAIRRNTRKPRRVKRSKS